MTWEEVRKHFPNCWVVAEALKSRYEDGYFVPEDIAVHDSFTEGSLMMRAYRERRSQWPERRIFFYSTVHPAIHMKVIRGVGPRVRVQAHETALAK